MKNGRKEERIPYSASLEYFVYGDITGKIYNCIVIDRSKNGLGIVSSFPLESGQLLKFLNKNVLSSNAVVQWRESLGVNYRIGLSLF